MVDQLLRVLSQLGLCGHPIHFHCFAYPRAVVDQWLSTCPNLYIGISAMVFSVPELSSVASVVPANRLLLETDSPFLSPPGVRFQRNHPWLLERVATRVAQLRNVPLNILVGRCNANACNLYRFPA